MVLFFAGIIALAAGLRFRMGGRLRVAAVGGGVVRGSADRHLSISAGCGGACVEMTVLDVGQGDSILVISPKGSALLIDGGGTFQGFQGREEHLGPDPGEDAVSPYLWSRGIKKLNAVALTHAHQDHIGGLTAVLQNFRVGEVVAGEGNGGACVCAIEGRGGADACACSLRIARTTFYVGRSAGGFSLAGDSAGRGCAAGKK